MLAHALNVAEEDSPHALIRFWSSAYARYRRPLPEGEAFHVPEFPAPLFSPNFVTGDRAVFLRRNRGFLSHFNEIVPLGHDQRGPAPEGFRLDKQFYLGERRLRRRGIPPAFSAKVVPLAEAVRGEELWVLLEDGFRRDAPFLRALLPFLASLDADFRVAFLTERGRTVGTVTVGAAGEAALVLNAVVPGVERGRGLSQVLTDVAQNEAVDAGAREAFFWTEHPFLGRHADLFRHYRIFSRTTV